jgi:hypothetical protein
MEDMVSRQMLREVMSEAPSDEWEDQATEDWENDPDAWKDPHYAAPRMVPLVDQFRDLYADQSLLEGLKGELGEASPEFVDLVKARWAQLVRDGDPSLPLTADSHELRALPEKDVAVTMDRMNEILRTVFDWMISQGKEPIPGWTQWLVQPGPQRMMDLLED